MSIANFLRLALNARRDEGDEIEVMEFYNKLQDAVKKLNWDDSIIERNLHEGFSGGEKKRSEILQLLVLEPKYAVLDETDSGLDIDALKVVSQGVNAARGAGLRGARHYALPAFAELHRPRRGSHHGEG